jgi:hypothetical protein
MKTAVLMIAAVCAGPACAQSVEDSRSSSATALNGATPKPTHCRLGPSDYMWPIVPAKTASDIVNAAGYDYEIVATYPMSPSSVPIALGDRFILEAHSTDRRRFKLTHSNKLGTPIAWSNLSLDGTNLWAKGDARLHGSKDVIGEYIVYRIPDNWAPRPRVCKHSPPTPPTCRSVHIEYFEETDGTNMPMKPELKAGSVEAISATQRCEPAAMETSEGDGDEGPA